MNELVEKVWGSVGFQNAVRENELAWLRRELGVGWRECEFPEAIRLMQAAAILACSENPEHKQVAFRVATRTYDLYGAQILPLDQALRVVLTRLGNFPSLATRGDVESAFSSLPLSLAAEEITYSEGRKVHFGQKSIYLTNFQHSLWTNLAGGNSLALAAPTSAGKSFVLQNYLASIFKAAENYVVVYIVPTRALIAQVAEDLAECFKGFKGVKPEIITVPFDGGLICRVGQFTF